MSNGRFAQRGYWYLLTGLVFGLVLGLVYAWLINPVDYVNTIPSSLREDYRDQYRLMIALAYAANKDLVRASERLKLLNDDDPVRTLTEQAQRILAEDGSMEDARALGALATAMQQNVIQPTTSPEP